MLIKLANADCIEGTVFTACICQVHLGTWSVDSITSFIQLLYSTCVIFRYKFDDERVTKEDMKKALEEQYGGEEVLFVEQFLQNFLYSAFLLQVICIFKVMILIIFPYDVTVTADKPRVQ